MVHLGLGGRASSRADREPWASIELLPRPVARRRGGFAYVPALAGLFTDCWLGEAIEISLEPDVREIERIRRAVFGGSDARPLKHLGEAQTCYVIVNWDEFAGSWWVSDDQEALRYARSQGITTRETIDLVNLAVANGDIEASDAVKLMVQMADQGRNLRLPTSAANLQR